MDEVLEGARSHLDALPTCILAHAFSFLHHADVARMALTCSRMTPIAFDNQLWRGVYLRLHSNADPPRRQEEVDHQCWRSRCLAKRKEFEYKRALMYGRVGRIATTRGVVKYDRDTSWESYLTGRTLALPAGTSAGSVSRAHELLHGVAASSPADSSTHVQARQGCCTWSVLQPALRNAEAPLAAAV